MTDIKQLAQAERHSYNFRDKSGEVYNSWTLTEYIKTENKRSFYKCVCICGSERVMDIKNILKGISKSCGCAHSRKYEFHGMRRTRAYKTWSSIKSRCRNPKATAWKYYGGRGINICDDWYNSFEAFYEYMGNPPDGYSIDRINNEGNYEPGNCKWSTKSEQAKNRRKPINPPKS